MLRLVVLRILVLRMTIASSLSLSLSVCLSLSLSVSCFLSLLHNLLPVSQISFSALAPSIHIQMDVHADDIQTIEISHIPKLSHGMSGTGLHS